MMYIAYRKTMKMILCILDGWGYGALNNFNAIHIGNTPTWSRWLNTCPWTILQASGLWVGLPKNQMGNSEVGHMSIGAGRVVQQALSRINSQIEKAHTIPVMQDFLHNSRTCHILGLFSPGGVHSHQDHIMHLYKVITSQGINTHIHAFLDGRDTPPRSASTYLQNVPDIQSVMGRFYAMDRDKRWDRTELAYNALMGHCSHHFSSALDYIKTQDTGDEFVKPAIHKDFPGIQSGDNILIANFRADRIKQILSAFTTKDFSAFPRQPIDTKHIMGLVPYGEEFAHIQTLFPKENIHDSFGEIISHHGFTQLRVAETEKYAHVTYFFNGGIQQPFPNESRCLVPSPRVSTYDKAPSMSAEDITKTIEKEGVHHDVIIANYANADMVGHTGLFHQTCQAVETVDKQLSRLETLAQNHNAALFVTADHGNADYMTPPYQTSHSLNPVPFVCAYSPKPFTFTQSGSLIDVAPTLLHYLGIPLPAAMSGDILGR